MKTGLTLEQLAAEITRQQSAKEDYVVNTGNLRLESYGPELTLRVLDSDGADRIEPLEIGDIAHRQIGTHLSIPAKYYERMRSEDPGLLAHNVNTWLERTPAQRMIRVLDGKARAYLSNRYLRMDNYSIASAVLPILAEIPDVRIESCQITDSRMYIKAVNPRLQEDVTPGDTVQAGVVISNSEVGLGSVNIQPLIYRLVCSNGMVVNDAATKRNHIGRATDAEENFQLYSEKTLAADDHAFLLKVQDTVRAAAEEARFAQVVGMMREAAAIPMNTADVPGVVKLASRQFGLTDSEGEGILQHLIEGHDLSLYGLSNKRFAQYFLNRGVIGFEFNGREYSICITEAVCFPQALAATAPVFKRLQLGTVAKATVIDIGGFTADYLSLRYGAADWASCDSLENGVITLYNRLLSKIRADHDLLLEETDIDSILTGCSTEYGSEIQTLVERGAESFVADLFRTLRERKIELRTGKVIFVGGGSLLLRKQIEKSGKVGTAIFVEEIGANAAGYGLLYAATKTSR